MPYLEQADGKIWWETTGSGPALMIIQGLGYSSDASWRLLRGLSSRHTVITVDNCGVGRSDLPEEELTVERMAADAAAVIEAAQLGPVHVIGFSMGGLIAQELLLSHPQLVCSVVLGCTSPGGAAAVPFTPEMGARLLDLATLPAREAAEKSASIVYSSRTAVAEIVADIDVRMARPTSREGYLAQLMAIGRYPGALDRLGQVERPVLILHGDSDLLVPP